MDKTRRRKIYHIFLILICTALLSVAESTNVLAQDNQYDKILMEAESVAESINKTDKSYTLYGTDNIDKYHEFKMKREENRLYYVATITLFAFLSLLLALFRAGWRKPVSTNYVVNVTGLVLIIYGTLVLTLMAETEQQLTAAIGILGAVAGYLFGTMRRGPEPIPEPYDRAPDVKP